MGKTDRLLNLLAALINTSRPLTAEELMHRVPGYADTDGESQRRMFERDKENLREMGVPLQTELDETRDPPRDAYIVHRNDYELQDPKLTQEELAALHLARSAVHLEGVDQDNLGDGLRKLGGVVASADSSIAVLAHIPGIGESHALDQLEQVFQAVRDYRTVTFSYGDKERTVEPQRVWSSRGSWYLTGFDQFAQDLRHFRIDRINSSIELSEPGSFEPLAASELVTFRPWEYGNENPVAVHVLVDSGVVHSVHQEFGGLRTVETRANGDEVIELLVSNIDGLFRFIYALLEYCEVLAPIEVRKRVIADLQAWTLKGVENGS